MQTPGKNSNFELSLPPKTDYVFQALRSFLFRQFASLKVGRVFYGDLYFNNIMDEFIFGNYDDVPLEALVTMQG